VREDFWRCPKWNFVSTANAELLKLQALIKRNGLGGKKVPNKLNTTLPNETENHWASGLCPSFGILNNCKTQRFGNWNCFRLQVREGKHLLCWVPQKELTSITGRQKPSDSVTHHRQNPFDSTNEIRFLLNVGNFCNPCHKRTLCVERPLRAKRQTKMLSLVEYRLLTIQYASEICTGDGCCYGAAWQHGPPWQFGHVTPLFSLQDNNMKKGAMLLLRSSRDLPGEREEPIHTSFGIIGKIRPGSNRAKRRMNVYSSGLQTGVRENILHHRHRTLWS
jgi:hypothetical protein